MSAASLLAAEAISRGSGAYNLACLEAKLGNVAEAVRWLQLSVSAGEHLSKSKAAAEKDFDRIRQQPEFIAYFESLPDE